MAKRENRSRGTQAGRPRERRPVTEDWTSDLVTTTAEEKTNPLTTLVTFLALMLTAAVLCLIIWQVTHRSKPVLPVVGLEPSTPASEELMTETLAEELPDVDADEPVTPVNVISGDTSMEFTPTATGEEQDLVTAKDVTNLRSAPSTLDNKNVVAQLLNGDVVERIGINEQTGWSKLLYGGQEVYAVSQYLTGNLDYETEAPEEDANRITTQDGRVIIFMNWDDYVTADDTVNLRTEPSTSQGNATVSTQLRHGDVAHRTGYSADSGWSRVEYNGQTLYVVTSYISVTEE